MAEHFDLLPSEVIRAVQDGDESVLESKTVWMCASCQTCLTRCPNNIDIPGVIDNFRQATVENASVEETARFYKTFMKNSRFFGRLFEAGLMAELNLREGQPLRDLKLGLRMLGKKKLPLLPSIARAPKKTTPLQKKANRIAYYPGCSLHSTGIAFDRSFLDVCHGLGIELMDIPDWTCCGSSPSHGVDAFKSVLMPIRNLVTVERMGLDSLVAPCAACYSRFKAASRHYRENPELAKRVTEELGYEYKGTVKILTAIDCLSQLPTRELTDQVKKPLEGLNVACYYGCLLKRPTMDTGATEVENPVDMDILVRALGAEPIDWCRKTDCCGGSLAVPLTDITKKMTALVLTDAKERGADVIAVCCPLCEVNLSERQPEMEEELGFTIPILFITQLMAVAMGLSPDAQGLDKGTIPPEPVYKLLGHTDPSDD